LVWLTIVQI